MIMQFRILKFKNYIDINTDVVEEDNTEIPEENFLYQNYPNPFNGESIISFNLNISGSVKLSIYDILGRQIKALIDNNLSLGKYSYSWDGTNSSGRKVSSGVYFYELKTSKFSLKRKMILLQ